MQGGPKLKDSNINKLNRDGREGARGTYPITCEIGPRSKRHERNISLSKYSLLVIRGDSKGILTTSMFRGLHLNRDAVTSLKNLLYQTKMPLSYLIFYNTRLLQGNEHHPATLFPETNVGIACFC